MMTNVAKSDRDSIVSKVIETVETKHFDPQFDKERWRSTVAPERTRLLEGTTRFDLNTSSTSWFAHSEVLMPASSTRTVARRFPRAWRPVSSTVSRTNVRPHSPNPLKRGT